MGDRRLSNQLHQLPLDPQRHSSLSTSPPSATRQTQSQYQEWAPRLNRDFADTSSSEVGSVSSPDLYDYLPPGHIRLVRVYVLSRISDKSRPPLEPFHETSSFALELFALPLHTRSRGQEGGYVALSHHWGTSKSTSTGNIYTQTRTPPAGSASTSQRRRSGQDSDPQSFTLRIKGELQMAIGSMCELLDRDYFDLWVDQICINQSLESQKEKVEQVALMRDIYEGASRVVCWLGNASRSTDIAIDALHDLYRRISLIQDPKQTFAANTIESLSNSPTLQDPLVWAGVQDLCLRPWFSRAWVYQEASAVRNTILLCGSKQVNFGDAGHIIWLLAHLASDPFYGDRFTQFSSFDRSRFKEVMRFAENRKWNKSSSLLELATTIRKADATNPRDKLFCVLSFASIIGAPDLRSLLDYQKPISHLFCEFTARHAFQYRDLRFLSVARWMANRHPDLPGWVPDWTQQDGVPLCLPEDLEIVSRCSRFFRASGPLTNRLSLVGARPEFPQVLVVDGVKISTISKVLQGKVPDAEQNATTQSWQLSPAANRRCELNRLDWTEVYKRTVIFDIYTRESNYGSNSTTTTGVVHTPAEDLLRQGMAENMTVDRRIFFTNPLTSGGSRLMGMGPEWMEEGMEIWMFKGGEMLYLLSPTLSFPHDRQLTTLDVTGAASSAKYTFRKNIRRLEFRGECFILGLMDGELVEMMERQRPRPRCLRDLASEFTRIAVH